MADHPSFYDQIKAGVGAFSEARADGTITFREILILSSHINAAAVHVVEAIDNPSEHLEEAIRDTERVFDEFIVPYDIPKIGPVIERFIEQQARAQIRPMLTALVDFKVSA